VITGVLPHTSLALVVAFLVPAALVGHRFWEIDDERLREAEMGNFCKNVSLAAAALTMFALDVPWAFSL